MNSYESFFLNGVRVFGIEQQELQEAVRKGRAWFQETEYLRGDAFGLVNKCIGLYGKGEGRKPRDEFFDGDGCITRDERKAYERITSRKATLGDIQ